MKIPRKDISYIYTNTKVYTLFYITELSALSYPNI